MNYKRLVLLMVAVAAVLDILGSVALAGDLRSIIWSETSAGQERELVLTFDDSEPHVEIRVDGSDGTVRVPGTAPELILPDGVSLVPATGPGGPVLSLNSGRLRGMRVEGPRVVLLVSSADAPMSRDEYRLGVGDVVIVTVYQDRDLSGEYPIGQDGMVNVPLAGAVSAAGLKESELAARLRGRLGVFLVEPRVTVSISEFESQFVYVNSLLTGGSTKIALRPGKALKDVLSEAGIALIPGQEVELSRARPGGDSEIVRLSFEDLDHAGVPAPRAGDVLTVQLPDYVFVRGEVRQPSRILHVPGLTLQQALTMVQGLTDWANRKEIMILRTTENGQEEISANLKRIEQGRAPDPQLLAGDLVIVRRRAF